MTLDSDRESFRIGGGTLWDGQRLYDLYHGAATPWAWFPRLQAEARALDLDFFSSPFDPTAVAMLQALDVPAYKIASFEIVDLPLIACVARTGRPLILSTGMATFAEIDEAVQAARTAGATEIALMKCCSAYPAAAGDMHLRTIPHMAEAFSVPVGLSDHTLGHTAAVAAVALGACLVEKHLIRSRSRHGPDSAFSMAPDEFAAMVTAIRLTEQACGSVHYGSSAEEAKSRQFRRSLFVTKPIAAGEPLTADNVRAIRPAHGLPPKHYPDVLGRLAACDLEPGMPLSWELLQ